MPPLCKAETSFPAAGPLPGSVDVVTLASLLLEHPIQSHDGHVRLCSALTCYMCRGTKEPAPPGPVVFRASLNEGDSEPENKGCAGQEVWGRAWHRGFSTVLTGKLPL